MGSQGHSPPVGTIHKGSWCPQARIKGTECWPLTGVVFLWPGEQSQAHISSSLLPSPGPMAHGEESCVQILSHEKSCPHTSPIVLNTEMPLGRGVLGWGHLGASYAGSCWCLSHGVSSRATVARTGARLDQLSNTPTQSRQPPAVAGCLLTQLRESGGCCFLLTSGPAQGSHTALPVTRPQPRALSWPCAPTCLYLVSVLGSHGRAPSPPQACGRRPEQATAGRVRGFVVPQSRLAGRRRKRDTYWRPVMQEVAGPPNLSLSACSFHLPPQYCPGPTWKTRTPQSL